MVYEKLNLIPDVTFPDQQPNASGIMRLRLVPSNRLQFIKPERWPRTGLTGYDDFTLSSQHLYFTEDATITNVDLLPLYAGFSEDSESNSQGVFYRPSIQITVPKIRPEVTVWMQRYQQVKWIAFIQDRNGYCRCVGTPDQPLMLAMGQTTGGGINGRNQTTLTFSASVEQPAYYMTGIDDADLINGSADFDDSFGFDFNS
jgi:hypothetical protein